MKTYALIGLLLSLFTIVFGYAIGLFLVQYAESGDTISFITVAVAVAIIYILIAMLVGFLADKISNYLQQRKNSLPQTPSNQI